MTRKPRPWEVIAKFSANRDCSLAGLGERRITRVDVCWWSTEAGPETMEADIIATGQGGLELRWNLSARDIPDDLPDWLREMALDCKPSWADVSEWQL